MDKRRDSFNVRLLELKDPFYDYVDFHDLSRSKVIRHFIKQGIKGEGGVTLDERKQYREDVIAIKRELRGIGINLNQTARYFNQHEHLIESELYKNHKSLQQEQVKLSNLLNDILGRL